MNCMSCTYQSQHVTEKTDLLRHDMKNIVMFYWLLSGNSLFPGKGSGRERLPATKAIIVM